MNLISKKEAAEMLGVAERTIDNYVKQGRIIAYYPGGHKASGGFVKFDADELANFFKPATTELVDG